jgi:hypothetical protein
VYAPASRRNRARTACGTGYAGLAKLPAIRRRPARVPGGGAPLSPEHMSIGPSEEHVATPPAPASEAPRRTLLLVAGSGRSGTSLFTGILSRLGFHVPQPEVVADSTNPRGFSESKWVVDFHTKLLNRAGVQVADARPSAWALTANVALDEAVKQELRGWLEEEFRQSDDVVIKDPRLSWFLPLWRTCGEEVGAAVRFATVLRHPAAVVESKQRSYGNWQGEIDRTAGWVNQSLFTERATRDHPRSVVRYQDLLDDWTHTVGRVGEELNLAAVRDAPAQAIVQVHEFVDRSLSRSQATWEDFEIPASLRALADEVWELMSAIAEDGPPGDPAIERLEAARVAYVELYEDSEAIAQSSVVAARRNVRRSRVPRAVRLVPKRYRRKVPLRWRVTVARALSRRGVPNT